MLGQDRSGYFILG